MGDVAEWLVSFLPLASRHVDVVRCDALPFFFFFVRTPVVSLQEKEYDALLECEAELECFHVCASNY